MLQKTFATFGLILGLVSTAILPAQANDIEHRIHIQQHRIHQGVKSGQLTVREHRQDEHALRSISNERNRMLQAHKGRLTHRDKAKLNHRLNLSSRHIYRTKHNSTQRHGTSK